MFRFRSYVCARLVLVVMALAITALPFAALARKKPKQQGSSLPRAVILDVVALDNNGSPVTDLLASDVRISDNGKWQQVALFRPNFAKRRNTEALVADEYSNREHPTLPRTVILFDLMNERFATDAIAQNELVHALEDQETGEALYLYILTNRGDFIPIHPLLSQEAETVRRANWTRQIHPLLDSVMKKIFGFRPPDDWDPGYRFQATLQAVSALGAQMALVPGRKNLVWVTHGVPITVPDVSGDPIDLSPQVHHFAATLEKAHIAVYAVDQSSKGAGATLGTFSMQTLESVSELTGGRYYASDSVEAAINKARADLRASYKVGYFAPLQEENGKFHRVRVASSRRGLQLNTQRGYYAFPYTELGGQQEAALNAAATDPFDSSEIGVRAKIQRDASQAAHLDIRIDANDVLFRQLGDQFEGDLLLAVFPWDSGDPSRSEGFATRRQPLTAVPIHLSMTLEERNKAMRDGAGITRDIVLLDSNSKIKLIVLDQNLGAYGSLGIRLSADNPGS